MAKNKTSKIPHYELLYIISNKYSENELGPIIDKIKKIINNNSGNITYTEEWGKKRLAYPIKHFRYGYYFLAEFDLSSENLAKVDMDLRMAGEILRHQIVNKKQKTAEEIEKEKKVAKKIAAKKEKELTAPDVRPSIPSDKKKKVELKDLDEKLDKILDTDDLL